MINRYHLITLTVLISDHLTKWIVRSTIDPYQTIELIPNYLRLSCVRNSGVAFGFFADVESPLKPYILAAVAIVAIVIILVYSRRVPLQRTLLQIALAITLSGILGNFIDRIVHGFVIDFIEFHIYESFYWPTFNVADSSITIGIALLLIDTIKNPEMDKAKRQAAVDNAQQHK